MGENLSYFLEVERLIREENIPWLKACEIAKKKKDCKSSQNNLKLNSNISEKDIDYNIERNMFRRWD